MSKKSFKVDVEPQIFYWMLETSGYKPEDISDKLGINKETVEKWLNKKDMPTLEQVEELCELFERPLAAFLLSEAPKEPDLPKDRRSIALAKPLTPKTYRKIRTARWIQSISESLMTNLGLDTKPQIEIASSSDDPQKIAQRERNLFGISIEEQINWEDEYEAFDQWREHIESKNIIVLQIPMTIEEVRGFSLTDQEPFVIVVSSSDDQNAKIFTLFHEYAHALLKDASICNPFHEMGNLQEKHEHEYWCNYFAGSFLMPEESFKDKFNSSGNTDLFRKLTWISNKFKVSKHAALVRLRTLELINPTAYEMTLDKLKAKDIPQKGGGQGLTTPERRLKERGKKFVSLVMENNKEEHITYNDALDYLSIKTTDFDNLHSILIEK